MNPLITIVFAVYNEEENLKNLYQRLTAVADSLSDYCFEFIFVDDCSSDATPEILNQFYQHDHRVKSIRFARNAGSHAALRAGLHHAKGDAVVVLAADLQDPPEIIPELLEKWKEGKQIVWGVRSKREGESLTTKFFSVMYYRLMNWLTNVKMPPLGADVFLVDKNVVNAFRKITEKHTSVFMTLAWLGFKQGSIEYVKNARAKGVSKWTLSKKIKLLLDSTLAFSDIPIRYMSVLGFITAGLGFIYAMYVFWCYVNGSPVEGWSSLIVAILVVGGVQMMMLGILGEYLWRTFDESRQRPQYVVEYVLESKIDLEVTKSQGHKVT
ncbi:MAG: glycosyltransferase family 2 protein [Candidatus Omnitrophica bacterium]|nr:glycosyltransferase family 2 protein [Candidatus Omnitrophota bacterium]